MLACTCFVVISKHRQYERAHRQLESLYQAKIKAEISAVEFLNEEQRQLQEHLSEVTALADSTKQANDACKRATSSIADNLAAKDQSARDLERRIEAAEAGRVRAEADAAASRSLTEVGLADLRSKAQAAEARTSEVQAKLDLEKKERRRLEEEAARIGLMRHVPKLPSNDDLTYGKHGELALLLKQLSRNGEVLLAVCDREMTHPDDYLTPWVRQAKHLGLTNTLVMSTDSTVLGKVKALGMDALMISPKALPHTNSKAYQAAAKWAAVGLILDLGYSVLYSDVDVALLRDPFPLLKKDSDLEAMSSAWDKDLAYGVGEPALGDQDGRRWQVRIAGLSPGLLYLRPSQAALDLSSSMVRDLQFKKDPEAALLDRAALAPTHGGHERPVRLRVMEHGRFFSGGALFSAPAGTRAEALRRREAAAVHVDRSQGERLQRLKAVLQYSEGSGNALEAFPGLSPSGGGRGRRLSTSEPAAAAEVPEGRGGDRDGMERLLKRLKW